MKYNNEGNTILMVEDVESIITFTSRALELEGYNIIKAATSKEALVALQSNEVDLVLLDLMLADGDTGWVVMEQMKTMHQLTHVPVIVYTAAIDQSNQERALQMGAVDFLTKPVGVVTLKETVLRALSREKGK